jgi:hypothetical protein
MKAAGSCKIQVINLEGFKKRLILFKFKEDENFIPEAYLKYVED